MEPSYYESPYRHLLAGLAFQEPEAPAMVSALEDVMERLVVPAVFVELDWRTTCVTPAVDLERGRAPQWGGREWGDLRRAGRELESGSVEGRRRDVPATLPPDPSADPVHALVRGLAGRPGTLAWSVQEWAVRDLGEHAVATERWLLAVAERLGADSGFVTSTSSAPRTVPVPGSTSSGNRPPGGTSAVTPGASAGERCSGPDRQRRSATTRWTGCVTRCPGPSSTASPAVVSGSGSGRIPGTWGGKRSASCARCCAPRCRRAPGLPRSTSRRREPGRIPQPPYLV